MSLSDWIPSADTVEKTIGSGADWVLNSLGVPPSSTWGQGTIFQNTAREDVINKQYNPDNGSDLSGILGIGLIVVIVALLFGGRRK